MAKIVEGATNSDMQKVASYTRQLADRLDAAGEGEAAKRLRRSLQNSPSGTLGVSRAGQLKQLAEDCVRGAVLSGSPGVDVTAAVRSALRANPKTADLACASVADQMRALRALDKRAFTQARLAALFNVSQTWVSNHLRGTS